VDRFVSKARYPFAELVSAFTARSAAPASPISLTGTIGGQ
jgi:hypothetical protein